ncbi:MAG: galactose mutarotase, partial [Erysipelotrichaceae bacterium]|nr:galactose mutarotase [Erysipelotrichaceae bacterium]
MIYTIENEFLQIRVSTLGATLVSFIEKKTGTDIVLGYDDEKNYLLYSDAHLGATVGRNANRIGKGRFSISGEEYQLTINNGPNDLHSGAGDFSFRSFDVRNVEKDQITFSIKDNDMSGGFPGDLYLEVSYTLRENELIYSYRGLCNKD